MSKNVVLLYRGAPENLDEATKALYKLVPAGDLTPKTSNMFETTIDSAQETALAQQSTWKVIIPSFAYTNPPKFAIKNKK